MREMEIELDDDMAREIEEVCRATGQDVEDFVLHALRRHLGLLPPRGIEGEIKNEVLRQQDTPASGMTAVGAADHEL
jgi:hypothetical protein